MNFREFYKKNREKIILAGYFTIAIVAGTTAGYCVSKCINNNYHNGFRDGYNKGAKDGTIYGMDLQLDQIINGSDDVVKDMKNGLCYKINVSPISENDITCDMKGTKEIIKNAWSDVSADAVRVHAE